MSTNNPTTLLRCKICEELIHPLILGKHTPLCRQLNDASKKIKHVDRLLLHYLDRTDLDVRVMVCGRAASEVVGTSLASPAKLTKVISVLKQLDDAANLLHHTTSYTGGSSTSEQTVAPSLKTGTLQQLILDKRKSVKEAIKTSFEIDSLSLSHATTSPLRHRTGSTNTEKTSTENTQDTQHRKPWHSSVSTDDILNLLNTAS
jgi:SpoU rRNA methylase family enzyme